MTTETKEVRREMSEVFTKNFHIMDSISPEQEKVCFVLGDWQPEKEVKLVGAQIGLLCCKPEDTKDWAIEIYLCVSRSKAVDGARNFEILKRDYLFYAQRDAYAPCVGIGDILLSTMLPSGDYFIVSKANPIYVKVGVFSPNSGHKYDAFCNLYFKRM